MRRPQDALVHELPKRRPAAAAPSRALAIGRRKRMTMRPLIANRRCALSTRTGILAPSSRMIATLGGIVVGVPAAMACSPAAKDSASGARDASSDVQDDASSAPTMNASDATLSFAESVYPIIRQNCTDHHSGSSPSGGLDMSDESRTFAKFAQDTTSEPGCLVPGSMEVEQYVVTGFPDESLLYQKVSGVGIPPSCGARMPYGGPYLSAADTDVIRDWIANGGAP